MPQTSKVAEALDYAQASTANHMWLPRWETMIAGAIAAHAPLRAQAAMLHRVYGIRKPSANAVRNLHAELERRRAAEAVAA